MKPEVLQKGNSPTVPVTDKETREFYLGGKRATGVSKVEKALREAEGGADSEKHGKDSGELPPFDFFKKK